VRERERAAAAGWHPQKRRKRSSKSIQNAATAVRRKNLHKRAKRIEMRQRIQVASHETQVTAQEEGAPVKKT
jgi:hypothetical protein